MTADKARLTLQDVEHILRVVESGRFDFVELDIDGLRLTAQFTDEAAMPRTRIRPAAPADESQPSVPESPPMLDISTTSDVTSESSVTVDPAGHPADHEDLSIVRTPIEGVFYRSPTPGAQPYVEVGDAVSEGDTIGLVEVMKLFSAITVDCAGVVEQISVKDGQMVKRGDEIARVRSG